MVKKNTTDFSVVPSIYILTDYIITIIKIARLFAAQEGSLSKHLFERKRYNLLIPLIVFGIRFTSHVKPETIAFPTVFSIAFPNRWTFTPNTERITNTKIRGSNQTMTPYEIAFNNNLPTKNNRDKIIIFLIFPFFIV